MKRKLLLGFCLLLVGLSYSQFTSVPDDDFEQYLITEGYDTNPVLDNQVLTSAISSLITLDLSNQNINDLTGLEDFTSLENLDVSGNDLNELVLQNLSLKTIKADNCNLAGKQISFRNNPPTGSFLTNVTNLSIAYNGFGNAGSTVSFGGVPNVTFLNIQGNNFGTVQLNKTLKVKSLFADDCTNLKILSNLELLVDLEGLTLSNCNFDDLNVSPNSILELLDVSSNNTLSELNIANGNNATLTSMSAQSTALSCIQVDDVNQAENAASWQKDAGTTYATNCNALNNIVEVSLNPNQALDADGNYVISSGTNEIFIGFDLEDENGNELPPGALGSYDLQISTLEHPTKNTATGGVVPTPGVDFELISNAPISVTTANGAIDGNRRVAIGGDGIFEGDEYFLVEVRTSDANITLKNAVNGVVLLPVRIIDNEVTNVNLSIVNNGIEGSQDVKLRINSSLVNNTGADMPFTIALQNGSATENVDFELINKTIQLPNGQSFVDVDITVNPDSDTTEGPENFTATVAYAGDIDPNRVTIVNGIVTATITDDTSNTNPVQVAVRLFKDFNFQNETKVFGEDVNSNSVRIALDALGVSSSEFPQYEVAIKTRNGNAISDSDYISFNELVLRNTIDSGYDSGSDSSIIFIKQDSELNETDETFFIDITPNSTDFILVDYGSNPQGTPLGVGETLSLEVFIENSNEYFGDEGVISFETELKGDIKGVSGNYNIDEGGTIELWIETENFSAIDGFEFEYQLNISGVSEDDYSILNEPSSITVKQENPDEKLVIKLNEDTLNEANESITITLQAVNEYLDWKNGQEDPFFPDEPKQILQYTIFINDITPIDTDFVVTLENLDGTEGDVDDVFTLRLTNKDGSPFVADQDIIFPVIFSPAEVNPAEIEDYEPRSEQFVILANNSMATLNVELPDEDEEKLQEDGEREFYTVTVENPTNFNGSILLPSPLNAKILDDEGNFNVSISLLTPLPKEDTTGNGCCNYYIAEEGQSIIFEFDAESGVPEGKKYKVELSYGSATYPITADEATEGSDFRTEIDPNDQKIFIWEANRDTSLPDNRLGIKIIADDITEIEAFNISLKPVSGEKFQGSISRDIQIIDTDPVSIKSLVSIAKEKPIINGEFIVQLDNNKSNTKMTPLRVDYIVDNSGSGNKADNEDFEPLSGYVEILPNANSAKIIVVPIDDSKFELDETLRIKLIDGPGYSIDETSDLASITIQSDDLAEYVAITKESIDNTSRESDAADFAEVLIELDDVPEIDVEVVIKISTKTDTQQVIEGQDFIIYQNDKVTPITSENRKVLFEAGMTKTKSIFVKALPDTEQEGNERLYLTLDFGVNYSIGSPNEAEIILISSSADTSIFNPGDIKLIAQSPRCPGDDQEGELFLENDSPFPFEINVVGLNELLYDSSQELAENDSEDNSQLFGQLAIGNYQISLSFKPNTGITYPDVILPTYRVQITAFNGMTAEESGVEGGLVSLKVSGSTSYVVTTNGKNYLFEFADEFENSIKVPLEQGVNLLDIKGDSDCKGSIEKRILLNTLSIYPNPAQEQVFLQSSLLSGKTELHLFDMSGRLVYRKLTDSQTNTLNLNVSTLEKGMYLGIIKSNDTRKIEFKLLKN